MVKQILIFVFSACLALSCKKQEITPDVYETAVENYTNPKSFIDGPSLVVLGTTQDAGSPQIGCTKDCCKGLFKNPDEEKQVSSLGLIDPSEGTTYLFDATPDITSQAKLLTQLKETNSAEIPNGIFLTHAHIGHYSGLMYLGKEAMDAKEISLFAMPRMTEFLKNNGPWSQLVTRKNILLHELIDEQTITLSKNLSITPFSVPHRDEFSETVGYLIEGPNKKVLFIPDIDKWSVWNKDISEEIKKVDYAFIDATFYDGEEINNRDIAQIPHPFVIESMATFEKLSKKNRAKVIFTHFNHTNPLLNPESKASKEVLNAGFRIARRGDIYKL